MDNYDLQIENIRLKQQLEVLETATEGYKRLFEKMHKAYSDHTKLHKMLLDKSIDLIKECIDTWKPDSIESVSLMERYSDFLEEVIQNELSMSNDLNTFSEKYDPFKEGN